MSSQENHSPIWFEKIAPAKSYRSIFKWGALDEFKHPNKRLYKLMKETFHLRDDHFDQPQNLGLEEVDFDIAVQMDKKHIQAFLELLGDENVKTDDYTRLSVSYGKTMIDIMRLREKIIENLPDVVLYPRDKQDIQAIVQYCDKYKIPVTVFGGGSTVTRGVECMKGGVQIDIRVHMNKVVRLNETNQTVTVESGIDGPSLEAALNNAPEIFNTKRRYTCGHFPQSFEYSVVGGWVVTRGAGQNSTYYGKIEHLVLAQEYVTPQGIIKTHEFPAQATGPDIDQIMMGSEGTYGILTECTLKVFRYMPENTRRFSFFFKDWESAVNANREMMQSESGRPSVFRLSDPEETDVAMKLYGVEGTPIDTLLKVTGYQPGKKCLLLGSSDGESGYTRHVKRIMKKIAKKHGGIYTTGLVTKKWEHSRFRDPYMREDLQDYGIIIDTLECAVNWKILHHVHQTVREYIKSRPDTICMTHSSHSYSQGTNLYFIFIAMMDREEFIEFHHGILDAINRSGAAISHHHGIGKSFAPFLESNIGKNQMDVIRALKKHFDPNGIMNPGGTLGLDD